MTLIVHPNITIKDERAKTPVQVERCRKVCPTHRKMCELEIPRHEGKCAHSKPDGTFCTWEGHR